jgi:hypothetical protein
MLRPGPGPVCGYCAHGHSRGATCSRLAVLQQPLASQTSEVHHVMPCSQRKRLMSLVDVHGEGYAVGEGMA